jgi:proteasome lid subunit RPN8/RPN11
MLELTRGVYDAVIDHAREGRPREVCGVLGGEAGDPALARTHRRAENAAADPRREYRIDPGEQLALLEAVETAGDVVGFYHSHPAGPPRPSPTDEARAAWEGYSYLIVAMDGEHPYVGSWRWTGEAFEREAVAVR